MSMSLRSRQARPVTPPPSNHDPHDGLQQVAAYNGGTSFPSQEEYSNSYEEDDVLANSPSSFGSSYHPSPEEFGAYNDGPTPFSYSQNVGLGISFEGSPTPMKREMPYGQIHDDPSMYDYGTPAMSPPQSNMSTPDVRRTRSGHIVNRPLQNLRSTPQPYSRSPSPKPKAKKVKKGKVKAESRVAKLDKPLSELTRNWTHVPVVDIEAYVNRSAEERRREIETGKTPGKVKRPMNSFMLYRKAYQNRTKSWCLQNNHQVVSQVCGDSWPLEPDSVRAQFNEWARLERLNHQNAHPGYKFSPSKAGSKAAAKRKAEESDEESVLSDFDWQGESRSHRPSKRQMLTPKRTPGPNQFTDSPYFTNSHPGSRESSMAPSMDGYQGYMSSSYSHVNPGRPAPVPYNQHLDERHSGQYWEQQVRRNGNVEDVIMRRTAPSSQHRHQYAGDSGHGASFDDMPNPYYSHHNPSHSRHVSQHTSQPHHSQLRDVKIDPSLMSSNIESHEIDSYEFNPLQSGVFAGGELDGELGGEWVPQDIGRPLQEEYPEYVGDQQTLAMPMMAHGGESWQVDNLEAEGEFGRWANGE